MEIPEGKFPGDPEFEDYVARWKDKNERWLKTTVARHTPAGPRDRVPPGGHLRAPPETPRDYR